MAKTIPTSLVLHEDDKELLDLIAAKTGKKTRTEAIRYLIEKARTDLALSRPTRKRVQTV